MIENIHLMSLPNEVHFLCKYEIIITKSKGFLQRRKKRKNKNVIKDNYKLNKARDLNVEQR